MSYDIKLGINHVGDSLTDIHKWLQEEQGWRHIIDWRWTKPDHFRNDWNYTFYFEKEEHAVLFALKWS